MLRSILIVLALALPLLTGAAEAQDTRTERVEFARGESSARVKGRVKGQDVAEYRIDARAGQEMAILLLPERPGVIFDLLPPGGGKVLATGGNDQGGPVRVVLPESGDYRLRVHLTKAAARKGTRVSYRLEISVTAPPEDLAGGPDYWEVTGVAPDDPLNLRAGPSTRDAILARLPAGTVLRNRGCRAVSGSRWCEVDHAGPPAVTGWVSGRFLREAAAPAEAVAVTEAPVAEAGPVAPAFSKTGRMPCRIGTDPAASCSWGLVAAGVGPAELHVTLPDGAIRMLALHPAGPRPAGGIDDLVWLRTATGLDVRLNGGREAFEIPAALLPR